MLFFLRFSCARHSSDPSSPVRSKQLRSSAMKGCTFCGAQVKNKVECGLCGAKACKQCETAKMVIAGGGACCRKHSPGWQAETAAPIQTQTQR